MNERIHDILDGATPEALEAAEEQELAAFRAAIAGSLETLPRGECPDLSRPVLWEVRELEPVPAWLPEPLVALWLWGARAFRWLWAPRQVQLRPALAFAWLALLVLLPVVTLRGGAGAEAEAPRLLVQFRLGTEAAQQVSLVGDFTGWEGRQELEQVAPGVWSVVVPLEPGMYEYGFLVDGERWVLDPLAPTVADGFGGENSRIAVLPPERGSAL